MSVQSATTRNDYTAGASQTVYAYTFEIKAASDITVIVGGVTKSLNTDYTVSGVGTNSGGNVTLSAAPASGTTVSLVMEMDLARDTDYQANGAFLADDVNNDFDSLWLATNQQETELGRSLRLNQTEPTSDMTLPLKDARKGSVLAFHETTGLPVAGPTIANVDSVAGITGDIATVADNDANITTVAGISGNVTSVANISANVTTVAGNTTNINAVAADASDIGTVASNISNVNTTAGISSDVTTVAGNNVNITTVAGDSSEITTVAGVASDVSTVSGIASDVTAVAGDASDIGTVASSISNVNAVGTNITNVNNVAGNASNINTVAADGTDIGTVAGISANVTTVAGISSDVTTVAGLETKMDTVIADASDIGTVAGISANVTTVANNSSNVTTVAGLETKMDTIIADASDIGAVATNINSVTTVSGISGDVTTVASKASDVETVADNIGDVQAASQNATNAAASAQAAASSASTAGTHATNASASANQAANSATGADDSEAAAGISASAASSSASAASSSASSAASSASDANDSQAAAALSASGASVSASAAATSASNAATSETNAANSATTATNIIADLVDLDSAVTNAAGSATSAATSASTALGYRNEAETHKNNAYTYSQSAASAVAYQDLAAIAESKSVSAVDVFVYDTSKDSDGGAWRHRTQGTSWYNEAVNTGVRGATKKFPAVAVIVAESGKVTIYDGDDPAMPMWMVFNTSNATYALGYTASTSAVTSIAMVNGVLSITKKDVTLDYNAGLRTFNLISEEMLNYGNAVLYNINGNIAGRHGGVSYVNTSLPSVVSRNCNDVAMTVLPNAPIDADTGLPVPTIAVATDGGVSVIKDDGSVVDLTSSQSGYTTSGLVVFDKDNRIFFSFDVDAIRNRRIWGYNTIPDTDTVVTTTVNFKQNADYYFGDYNPDYARDFAYFVSGTRNYAHIASKAVGTNSGLVPYSLNNQTPANSIHSEITSDYNTGWMNGDIKLATLSDTDDTNVTGSELVTNGTFNSNASGWTAVNAVVSWDSNGYIVVDDTANAGSDSRAYQNITTVAGKRYTLSVQGISTTSSFWLGVGNDTAHQNIYYSNSLGNTPKTFTHTFTASSTSTRVALISASTGVTKYDNVSVRLAEEDRSVNGNGLQVHGTITKTAVATGADLVAYSGFSSSNYLQQPYNSDLDFGTGDFCVMGWVKITDNDESIFDRGNGTSSANRLQLHIFNNTVRMVTAGTSIIAGGSVADGVWSHVSWKRQNGVGTCSLNGVTVATGTCIDNVSGAFPANIGVSHALAGGLSGSLALLRISATAPTAEQIAKIYRDEKPLFQENAKATLYGTSDAVTALAYDDDTELLHAGTSAGRSVFKGLQRVSNTTDAVGTAISASNDLVVEE